VKSGNVQELCSPNKARRRKRGWKPDEKPHRWQETQVSSVHYAKSPWWHAYYDEQMQPNRRKKDESERKPAHTMTKNLISPEQTPVSSV
jgi:hypothetical protein